ncbi:MAG: DUF2129 domain-containing protein [Streptococcus sp.]|nr:DUF2129 domain-containing protein [Streptococcus sp.]
MLELEERIGLIIYLYYNRDSKKVMNYGDVIYHSRKMRYLIMYVNKSRAANIVSELKKNKIIKAVKYSQLENIDQNFVGNLVR